MILTIFFNKVNSKDQIELFIFQKSEKLLLNLGDQQDILAKIKLK